MPSFSRSLSIVAPASSAQVQVFFGQPSDCAAEGTMATPTGEDATLPAEVTGSPLLSCETRSTHSEESGTHT